MMKVVLVALLGASAVSAAQGHRHAHRHAARHNRRAEVTSYVQGPVVTVYELDGTVIPADEVEQGLKDGIYVLVSQSSTSKVAPSTSAAPVKPATSSTKSSTSTTTTSLSSVQAAQFVQVKTTTSSTPIPTPTSTYVAPTTTSAPAAAPTTTKAAAATTSSSSGGSSTSGDINADFPSGSISCSNFPSSYGAMDLSYLGLGGWSGIQQTPSYSSGASSISEIITSISGGCTANSFCSYACPPGYQKSQWPTAQGSTGQSIGGLYCNSNGMLELSNPNLSKKICIPGTGGVSVKNSLSSLVSVCRTDYPGTESETVPTVIQPGGSQPLTCPDAATYYSWQGAATSAQYYINPAGADASTACKWGTAGSNMGNWAPVNLGVGKGLDGKTWISMFQNAPTNTDGCLDYSITLTGDVSATCSYKNCKFYTNGVESGNGCTTAVSGSAVYVLS